MESFLSTLKEQVKCSLCNETLNEPKLLPCFHVFCTTCIKAHLQLNDEQENIFHCPECNSETHLRQNQNEVEDLQVSPVHSRIVKVLEFIERQKICSVSSTHQEAVWQCVDCDRQLCEECLENHSEFIKNHQVISLSDLNEEDIKVMLKKERPCRVHDDHQVKLYCQDCDMLICVLCLEDRHNSHKTTTLQELIATERESLSKMLEDIDIINDINLDSDDKQEESAAQINREEEQQQEVQAVHEIEIFAQKKHQEEIALQIKRTKSEKEEEEEDQEEQEIEEEEQEEEEQEEAEEQQEIEEVKQKEQQEQIALQIKSEGEEAEQNVKDLTEKLIKILKNNEQQLLNKIRKSITKAKRNLRIIQHTTQAQEYIKYFMENGAASEMIDTRHDETSQNFSYDPFDHSDPGVEFTPNEMLCEQVEKGLGQVRTYLKKVDPTMSSVIVEPSEIEAMKKAQLIINCKTSKREDTDEVLENVKINFSPSNSVKKGEVEMADNSKITVDFTPRVSGPLSADIKLHHIQISNSPLVMLVKPQEILKHSWDSNLKYTLNTKSGNFTGIAVNKSKSRIAIADCDLNRVTVSRMDGINAHHGIQYEVNRPRGLAFLTESDLVIVESGYNRILIVNTKIKQIMRTFGAKGSGNGQLDGPRGVHVDEESHIIVCDYSNNRVQVFTKDGDYLYQFSVQAPYSVVKHNDRFYVSDWRNSVVGVIEMKDNESANTLITIGGQNYTDGRLLWPRGLAIDNDQNLLVCSSQSLIHKFTLNGGYVGRSSDFANTIRYIAALDDGQIICTTDKGVVLLTSK